MDKILTPKEWLKQNYPNATGWHEDYAKEYAEYYAKEMASQFINALHENGWIHTHVSLNDQKVKALYTQFLTEQNQTDARTESN